MPIIGIMNKCRILTRTLIIFIKITTNYGVLDFCILRKFSSAYILYIMNRSM